jgi:hypothetical protein
MRPLAEKRDVHKGITEPSLTLNSVPTCVTGHNCMLETIPSDTSFNLWCRKLQTFS